ncbi:MAG: fasciclin domain-containing protein [Microthrixaceae bacterium]
MRNRFLATSFALVLSLGLVATACSDSDSDGASGDSDATTTTEAMDESTTTEAEEMATEDETIVDIAVANPDFSTLAELVTQAGLAETLSGEGPFTVFAPTDDAFAAVDPATLAALSADPTGALADVLKMHVISSEVMAADAMAAVGTCVETLGGPVKVEQSGQDLTIGGVKVASTDIAASNGVIHVLDGVITAPSEGC